MRLETIRTSSWIRHKVHSILQKKKKLKGITGTQTFYYVIGNINKNNDIVLEEIRYAQDLKLGRDRPYGQGRAVHYSDLY